MQRTLANPLVAARAALALAVLIAAAPAAAQGIEFGVKGGVNLASLHFDQVEDAGLERRIGIIAGGFVIVPLAGRLQIQPEVLFTQKGAKFDESGVTGRFELDFLDVPILARYDFGAWHVFGGPSLGLKLRARSVFEFEDDTEETDLEDDVETLDLGVVAGAGFERGRLTFDGRYTYGLSNINGVERDDVKIATRGFAFMAGWRL